NLTIAASMIACHKNDFQKCFNASGKMLELLAKDHAASRKAVIENQIFHAFAAAALGKYDVYDGDMKKIDAEIVAGKGDPSKLDGFGQSIGPARPARMFIDVDHASELAIGTYHLLTGGKIKNTLDNADALVTLRLVNQDRALRSVTITAEVPGVTDP